MQLSHNDDVQGDDDLTFIIGRAIAAMTFQRKRERCYSVHSHCAVRTAT
jgi:hypothetical protein